MMGWTLDGVPGHDGYLIGLVRTPQLDDVRRRMDGYRELTTAEVALSRTGVYLWKVQVGCDCGWRSPRLEAPIGTAWWHAGVDAPAWFAAQCEQLWRDHSLAKPFDPIEASAAQVRG